MEFDIETLVRCRLRDSGDEGHQGVGKLISEALNFQKY